MSVRPLCSGIWSPHYGSLVTECGMLHSSYGGCVMIWRGNWGLCVFSLQRWDICSNIFRKLYVVHLSQQGFLENVFQGGVCNVTQTTLLLTYLLIWAVENAAQFLTLGRRACAARVTVVGLLSVCLSVCVSTLILALQATRRPISDTSGFRTTRAWKIKGRFSWNDCIREICRENKRKSQYA